MDDAPADIGGDDDIVCIDFLIEISDFSRSIAIETEYSVRRRWDSGGRR